MMPNEQGHQLVKQGRSSPRAEDIRPVAFFMAVYQAFQRAERVAGRPVTRFYVIGGHTIRLRFANPALVPSITRALEHLAAKSDRAPALTVCLWDSASTCTRMPPPPWSSDDYIARGEVRGFSNDHVHTAFYLGAGMLNMLDTKLKVGLFWIRDANLVPYQETAAPLRTILHWWMRNHGRQLVHAGAVGTSSGGVLLAGKGGSGKSTAALACLDSELLYAGDDHVLLSGGPAPFVHSVYNSAKLDADHMRRLPHLLPAVSNPERSDAEKALIFLHEHFRKGIANGFPLRAILLPHVTGLPKTRLRTASPATGLAALAPSTILQLSEAGPRDFHEIARVVKQVPCYTLELGTDVREVPGVVLRLLSERSSL